MWATDPAEPPARFAGSGEQLHEAASAALGGWTDFAPDAYLRGLDVLLQSMDYDPRWTEAGRRRGWATLVSVLEANIDDSSPQVLGYALEKLLDAGALDAALSPLQMKKNRPGSLLRVIARPEDQERLAQIIFAETSTLGLRIHTAERRVEPRSNVEIETPLGRVRGKISAQGAFTPEYDDCKAIAQRTGVPLPRVLAAAHQGYLRRGLPNDFE